MRRRTLLAGSVAACSGLALGSIGFGSRREPALAMLQGLTMGTYFRVSYPTSAVPADAIEHDVNALLARIDALMSTYRPESELSRFNAAGSTAPVEVAKETRDVVDEALQVATMTGGAFDVTVGPLVDLWGFGARARAPATPSDEALADAAGRVDHRALSFGDGAIRKSQSSLRVDLSGIAKGYAVDRLAAILDGHGIESYLVDIGGELRSRGVKPDGGPWRVGVERPVPGPRAVHRVVPLENRSIATSGDYRNYFVHEGRRYAHAIDPRTARPVRHALASVTVIEKDAMRADAISTGLMVMGPDEGLELARRHDVAAYFIVRAGDGFEERFTPAFEPFSAG